MKEKERRAADGGFMVQGVAHSHRQWSPASGTLVVAAGRFMYEDEVRRGGTMGGSLTWVWVHGCGRGDQRDEKDGNAEWRRPRLWYSEAEAAVEERERQQFPWLQGGG